MKNELSKTKKTCTTSKKVKYVGTERYISLTDGTIEEFQVTSIEERDFNFSKVWLRNFVAQMNLVGNQKTRLAWWIIDNLDRENRIICTYRKMADETGMSLSTVRDTMKALQDGDFLRKLGNGAYCVNPDTYFKGTHKARLNVLNQYQEIGYEPPKLTVEQQIGQLKTAIAEMQKSLAVLESKAAAAVDTTIDGQLEMLPDGSIVERAREDKGDAS